jgi:transcriptional regulator with XRE-family HTH domain
MRVDTDTLLGELLTEARLQAGLTCEAAALRAGLTPARVIELETAGGPVYLSELMPLLRIYGSTLERLCGWLAREVARRTKEQLLAGEAVGRGRS